MKFLLLLVKNNKEAYEKLEQEYEEYFSKRKYSDYNSYRNCRDRRLKKATVMGREIIKNSARLLTFPKILCQRSNARFLHKSAFAEKCILAFVFALENNALE